MSDQNAFEELRARMEQLLSGTPAKDIENNMRALLNSFFNRLELVTREEFDVQTELLQRTREQLARLEAKLALLEGTGAPPEK